ncbi:ABC-2 type transport system permease protein [Nocardia amikacinitolerans]|uniref:ABC-2 type transport system permease protein n=1 Tax=Nocardia amikacinitolerans TaxID=756689 RepID=A0A285KS64_9NOCA|nr:ABC transporter permease [Nocardia amikacinitolerans]SNY75494.1 ABC-2 type transport system permease protein [Nocardia amikacinitolerans]
MTASRSDSLRGGGRATGGPTAAAHRAPAATLFGGSADLAGTGQLLRLYLRRDRIVLPLWSLLIGLMPAFQVVSIKDLYTTQAQIDDFARTTADSPALIAMYGPVFSTELGSIGTWKAGAMYTMIAIATILTVIRHTRVEEETGRAELVGATSIGRFAGLTAALIMTFGGALVAGIACAASLYATDLPAAGSLAFGAALAASGIVWGAIAAVAAQVSAGARVARGVAFAALGAAFALRAVGDAGNGVLSWLSPIGWSLQIRPYADERWWVLLPLATVAVLATGAAYALLASRDTGSGLLAERPGPAAAAPGFAGPVALAWRLQRGTLLAWTVGFGLYGLLIGGAVNSVGDMLDDSGAITDLVTRMGGSESLEESFIAYAITMLAAAAGAYSISAALRLHDEESSQRAEATLAAAVGRTRYALSHIGFALAGPAIALLTAGLAIGVVYGLSTGEFGEKLPESLAAAAVQAPAVWVVTGITIAIFGLAPRYTPVAWGVLSGMIVIFFVGSLDGLPQWVVDLVPFVHPPKLPGAAFEATPILWLLGIAAALLAVGVAAYRRRDLR